MGIDIGFVGEDLASCAQARCAEHRKTLVGFAEQVDGQLLEVNRLPGPKVWLVLRRSLGEEPELKTYLSAAPAATAHIELARVSGMRWPVETALRDGKDRLGMDDYMVRTWLGWHHHMTQCILAHHFLVRVQQRLKGGRLP